MANVMHMTLNNL